MTLWFPRLISLFIALLIGSSAALAAESSISITDTPSIDVVETKAISEGAIGLLNADQAGLAEGIWKNTSHDSLSALLQNAPAGIISPSIRNLALRTILLQAEMPEGKNDLIAERAEALIKLGQPIAAEKLLQSVPSLFQKSHQKELQFLFTLLHAVKSEKEICSDATNALAAKARPFWQRWVVLCQAKAGEKDKAQLGIDLLDEQGEYSEFYQKIIQGILNKSPAVRLPEVVYLEQAAWLFFTGEKKYLSTLKAPPLAYAALYKDQWAALTKRFGLGKIPTSAPAAETYTPSLAYLKIPQKNASAKDKRLAFMAYSIRKSFGQPVSIELEQELSSQSYETPQIVTSPSWRESLKNAVEQQETGTAVLLIANTLTQELNHYAASDITFVISCLRQLGLEADAYALAQEAIESARGL